MNVYNIEPPRQPTMEVIGVYDFRCTFIRPGTIIPLGDQVGSIAVDDDDTFQFVPNDRTTGFKTIEGAFQYLIVFKDGKVARATASEMRTVLRCCNQELPE